MKIIFGFLSLFFTTLSALDSQSVVLSLGRTTKGIPQALAEAFLASISIYVFLKYRKV
jgi:hypothetical protein